MENKFTASVFINVNASISRVWEALTDPQIVKQYFFGVDIKTDWKAGSPIIYSGIWEGKAFEDKGNVLEIEKEKFIKMNYWTPSYGTEDKPENYLPISYELYKIGESETKVIIIQGGIDSEQTRDYTVKNWEMILDGLKKLLEN